MYNMVIILSKFACEDKANRCLKQPLDNEMLNSHSPLQLLVLDGVIECL